MKTFYSLLELKAAMIRNAFRKLLTRSKFELITLIFFFLVTGIGLFIFFHQGFRFFKGQEPFGSILIDQTFYLFNFVLFTMLFVSSAISSYASLFRSNEVVFLLARPIPWNQVYFLKVTEAVWFSSWAFLFLAVPFMSAYGLSKEVPWLVILLLTFLFYLPFVLLAGVLGTIASVLTVWLLPNRQSRHIALLIAVAIAILFLFKTGPEAIQEQGSVASILSGYLPQVTFSKYPLLPSAWTTQGILALTSDPGSLWRWSDGTFYLLVLLSNLFFFMIPSYSIGCLLFPKTYLRAQDHGESDPKKRARIHRHLESWLDRIPFTSRSAMAFLEKDIKTFSREASEWSQLIIFFGLLLVYFLNLKNLEFHILKDFWKNLVFILNTVGTYVVLSSFSMRFVFPMLSLEGSRAWIIGVAPIRLSSPVFEKFFLGTFVSALLTLPLVYLSGWLLEIPMERVFFTTGLGFFVCIALTGLSVGLGAIFPNFKSTNPSEIISGFGGAMVLTTHLGYLTAIGLALFLFKDPSGPAFLSLALASLAVGIFPLQLGIRALKKMEF